MLLFFVVEQSRQRNILKVTQSMKKIQNQRNCSSKKMLISRYDQQQMKKSIYSWMLSFALVLWKELCAKKKLIILWSEKFSERQN